MHEMDSKVLAEIRSEVCDTVLKWTAILGSGAVLLSFLRIIEFGLLPVMFVHAAMVVHLVTLYVLRRRVPYAFRAASIIGVMVLVAAGGHITFGTPTRIEFFIAATIMASVFFGQRAGVTMAAASVLLLAVLYAGFRADLFPTPVPTPPLSLTNWVANAASMVVAAMAPMIAVNRYRIHLNNEHRRLATASRAKSDFLATMSHELRTPMTAILGLSDVLLEEQPAGAVRDKIGRISKAGRLLLDLLNDVLDFSKIEAGAIVIKPGPFKPAEVIQDICDLFAPLASEKDVDLRATFAPGLPETLIADGARLRQAVLNLVGNAVKFTERGRIEVRAAVHMRGEAPWLSVDVADSGIGISEEQQGRLFKPFVQGEQSGARRYGGTGLGLAISRVFVELMGGSISLKSALGTGSTFTITVPVAISADAPAVAAAAAPIDPGPAGLRILAAEDNEAIRFLLKTMLQKWGHTVDTASDGRAAVEAARAKTYDAILMDMQMPEMDGLEAAREIRKIDSARHTPIIAVTADSIEHRRTYEDAGITAYTGKPVNWGELAQLLRAHAGKRSPAAATDTEHG